MHNTTISLNGNWRLFREKDQTELPAKVPGNVHQALLDAEMIPDPYYRENELGLQWIGEEAWTYSRLFTLSDDQLCADALRLCCKGLDTFARIEINGQSVGETDNMFREWDFDIRPVLKAGENEIRILFHSVLPYIGGKQQTRDLRTTHCIDHEPHGRSWVRKEACNFGWDWGPVLITHGIWREIEIQVGACGRLQDLQLRQHCTADAATVQGQVTFPAAPKSGLELRVTLSLAGREVLTRTQPAEKTDFELEIPDPQLWWPNNMGEQPLYEVKVEVTGVPDACLTKKIGLRKVALRREDDKWGQSFYFQINVVPMFAKGSNWIPADTLHRVDDAHYRDLLQSAKEGNQNMIRVWGGGYYEEDVFYDLCDELGLLVWQDFMFACAAYPADEPGFKESVEAEVRDQARRLSHHACMALWCGNNELEMFVAGFDGESWPHMPEAWYRKLFDEWIPDALAAVDPTALYWPSSPHSPQGERKRHANPDCGDAHLWDVWHGSQPFEWYRGSFHRFCSEFGFQSYPEMKTLETFTLPEDLNVTSPVMEFHQRSGVGNAKIIHYMLSWFRMPNGFVSTVMLSQLQQGLAIKYAVEHWRLNRPRCMGALYWQLNDCWPVASWASIDYFGRWKTLHYMSKRFFAPLLVAGVEHPETGRVDVYVASDQTVAKSLELRLRVTDCLGKTLLEEQHAVDIAPLSSQQVHQLDCQSLLEAIGPRNLLVWLEVWEDGKMVSDNLLHFVKPKHLELKKPKIEASVQAEDKQNFTLILSADVPALWVTIQLQNSDFRASDNAISLRPGEGRKISVHTHQQMTEKEFLSQLELQSITDYSNYL